MTTSKIFVIGLPRTGTTSLCDFLLQQGYRTAHCAYTDTVYELADALADTPIFTDYIKLDQRFPESKFILSTRPIDAWLESISVLLNKMSKGLFNNRPMFHPEVKRCFEQAFEPLTKDSAANKHHLADCYQHHINKAKKYFGARPSSLLIVDISDPNAHLSIAEFLGIATPSAALKRLNNNGTINDWQKLDHHLKIKATRESI